MKLRFRSLAFPNKNSGASASLKPVVEPGMHNEYFVLIRLPRKAEIGRLRVCLDTAARVRS